MGYFVLSVAQRLGWSIMIDLDDDFKFEISLTIMSIDCQPFNNYLRIKEIHW